MKLIKQAVLVFSEGRSDKVYEVDLCEVGTNQYVVNFRYGKRGAALKDGSKTAMPVARAEAERVFDKLVAQKTEQGYLPEGAPRPAPAAARAAAPPPPAPGTVPASQDPRAQKILERLAAGSGDRRWFRRGGAESAWKLERAIWRAGELRIREAESLLLPLVGTASGDKGLRDYCIAWALGFCGSAASVSTLGRLYGDARAPDHVRRVAAEALLTLSDQATRGEFQADMIAALPEPLRATARGDSPGALTAALATYLRGGDANALAVLDRLYLIDTPTVRPAVLAALDGPLKSPLFQRIRHIFKSAEYRRDAETFGKISHRFDKERANTFTWDDRRRGVTVAYSGATRLYLKRRVARTLRRLGQVGDPAYVPMAVGVLLPFTDADAAAVRSGYSSSDARNGHVDWGPWAPYLAFNSILYTNSPRYELPRAGKVWRLKRGVKPDAPAPSVREEAFPGLWEQNPAGLMHLCAESACTPVHEFAARALRACRRFCDELELDDVIMLLGRPYEPTARLGFEIAERRYDPHRIDTALLLAVARSAYGPGREKSFGWIDAQRVHVLGDSAFLAGLVVAPHADTRAYARRLLRSSTLAVDVGQALLGRLVASLLALGEGDEATAADAAQTITLAMSSHLGTVSVSVIRDLITHPLQGVQELGAELLLKHDSRTGLVPDDIILGVLHSAHESVRALGMRLIAELPDEVLVAVDRLLLRLTTDRNIDIRNAARPIVRRIAASQPEAAEYLAQQLVESLLRRLLAEGVPSHVLQVLNEDLSSSLANLPRETVWRLISSQSPHAQELGGILLGTHLDASDLELDQLVQLASHEILSIRQASWSMLERSTERVRAELASAVRVLDARWADSRQWATKFFREHFPPEAFTVEVVTTIVDSVRDDVQGFGREMIQRSFREEDGPELLRRLAEHPTRNVQLFTTNYLERFATDRPGKLESLMPYFTGVLSRVNQGRVAKMRVLAFLRVEGSKSEPAARVVVDLLHRLSASVSIEGRAGAVEAMVAIHRAQPGVPVPLRFRAPPLRGRVTA